MIDHLPLAAGNARARIAAAITFAFVLIFAPVRTSAASGETWDVQGTSYINVRVREVTGGSVTIFHSGGITQIDLARLPPELQSRFGYDTDKAQAWKQSTDAGLAETVQTKRRTEDQQTASVRRDAEAIRKVIASDVAGPVTLYPEVDLRPFYTKNGLYLKDQGRRASCSVFAIVSALEYEIARRRGHAEPLSEEFLVWAARRLQPDIPIDDGFHFEEVLSALQNFGIPRQKSMPNTFGKRVEELAPGPEALSEAPQLRTVVPVWIRANDPRLLERIVARLNEATPVVIGLRWPHWRTLERNAYVSDQVPLEGAGHAVTLIGYRSSNGNPESIAFLFRNSWGVRWGSGGCGYVSAKYVREQIITAFYLTLPGEPAIAAAAP